MEKAGFIERRDDPEDERISRVYLTDAGRDVRSEVEAVWHTFAAPASYSICIKIWGEIEDYSTTSGISMRVFQRVYASYCENIRP